MPKPLRVLILEDRLADAEVMVQEIRRAGFEPSWQRVETEVDFVTGLESPLDLILADYALPQFDAVRALERLVERGLDIPFIIVSGNIGEETAVAAMKAGAHDYVLKDKLGRLAPAIERELRDAEVRREKRRTEEALREKNTYLRLLVGQIPALIWTTDVDLRFTSLEGAGVAALLVPPYKLVGTPMADLFGAGGADTRVAKAHQKALRGKSVSVETACLERFFQLYVEPLQGPGGVVGCIGVGLDISERRQAQQVEAERTRLAAFSTEVGVALTQTDTLRDMLQLCAVAMVHHLEAALARIWTFNREEMVLELQASAGLHTHRTGPHGRIPIGTLKIGRIAQKRQPHLTNDLLNDPDLSDPAWARHEGLVAFAGYPLVVAGQMVGVMALFSRSCLSGFTLEALAAAADSIALGIHRKQTEEILLTTAEESLIARFIQKKLSPAAAPIVPGFEIAGLCMSAQATGGDFFDYIPLCSDRLGIVVGDVSGHGFGPALLMASTRAYVRALAQVQSDVGSILASVNRLLVADTGDDRSVKLVLARLDPASRSFVYGSAGQLAGLVLDQFGALKQRLESTGSPLGIGADSAFSSGGPIILEPGDMVLFLSDGLLDARAPDAAAFGIERVRDVVQLCQRDPAEQIVARLYEAARAFSQNMPQTDDITAVLIRARPTS